MRAIRGEIGELPLLSDWLEVEAGQFYLGDLTQAGDLSSLGVDSEEHSGRLRGLRLQQLQRLVECLKDKEQPSECNKKKKKDAKASSRFPGQQSGRHMSKKIVKLDRHSNSQSAFFFLEPILTQCKL